ncbi:hypothetical protein KM043_011735 [Ampulex compressa]|nr:hypothetical protein KM043_011735 [Ampulex compressa]
MRQRRRRGGGRRAGRRGKSGRARDREEREGETASTSGAEQPPSCGSFRRKPSPVRNREGLCAVSRSNILPPRARAQARVPSTGTRVPTRGGHPPEVLAGEISPWR